MRDGHWPSHPSNLIVIALATGFLILHGVENHRPPEHWQFLLAAQLVEHGLEVRYPALPEPDAPELERWLATLEHERRSYLPRCLPPRSCWYRAWWDVTGAKRVGLGTAWVSAKEQVLMPGSPAPDVQAPSLLDVAQGIVNKVGEREQ